MEAELTAWPSLLASTSQHSSLNSEVKDPQGLPEQSFSSSVSDGMGDPCPSLSSERKLGRNTRQHGRSWACDCGWRVGRRREGRAVGVWYTGQGQGLH